MMARRVAAPDHLQSELAFHGLGPGRSGQSRDIDAANHFALLLQGGDECLQTTVDSGSGGNNKTFIEGSGSRPELSVGCHGDACQILVADIVAVVTETVDGQNGLDKLRSLLVHRVDIEHHEQPAGVFTPQVAHGQIHQKVVVGLSPLQVGLATGDIGHERGGIAPNGVGGAHVHTGVEFPSRPRVVFRTVSRSVEEHAVHPGAEHEVEIGLHLAQRRAEVLGEPRKSFARGVFLTRDVGRRRGVFQHRKVTEIGACEPFVST